MYGPRNVRSIFFSLTQFSEKTEIFLNLLESQQTLEGRLEFCLKFSVALSALRQSETEDCELSLVEHCEHVYIWISLEFSEFHKPVDPLKPLVTILNVMAFLQT